MNRVVVVFLLSSSILFSQYIGNKSSEKREFEIDCNIRALEIENDSTCWFAGSNNKYGYTNNYGKTWKENIIKYDTFNLDFRSISVTTNSVFIEVLPYYLKLIRRRLITSWFIRKLKKKLFTILCNFGTMKMELLLEIQQKIV